jgi:hypothetical protein
MLCSVVKRIYSILRYLLVANHIKYGLNLLTHNVSLWFKPSSGQPDRIFPVVTVS